jgi:ketosteroid isomerase-like protein
MPLLRRSVLAASPVVLAAGGHATSASAAPAVASEEDVRHLVTLAEQAHEALMRGDLPRYRQLLAFSDDFTLMTPFGGNPTRPVALSEEQWAAIGRYFHNGRDSTFELVQAYRSVDQVVLVGLESSHVEVGGLPAQDWVLRVTLVFTRKNGQWLLAHRHADGLAGGITLQQAAVLAQVRATANK